MTTNTAMLLCPEMRELTALRDALPITQTQLAQRLGISSEAVSVVERGDRQSSEAWRRRYREALLAELEEIPEGSKSKLHTIIERALIHGGDSPLNWLNLRMQEAKKLDAVVKSYTQKVDCGYW